MFGRSVRVGSGIERVGTDADRGYSDHLTLDRAVDCDQRLSCVQESIDTRNCDMSC